jgi:translation initiation factor 4G
VAAKQLAEVAVDGAASTLPAQSVEAIPGVSNAEDQKKEAPSIQKKPGKKGNIEPQHQVLIRCIQDHIFH